MHVEIGTNATYGGVGDVQTILDVATGTYPVTIYTYDAENRLMITVSSDEPAKYYFRLQEMEFEELALNIEQTFEANPDLRILIRSDSETKYKATEKVMMACAKVGAVDIIFAATEERGQ